MTSTPNSHPAIQRLNKAYVQVPPSPVSLSNYRAFATPTHVASSKQKENTPLRPFHIPMAEHASSSSSSSSLKRKMADREPSKLEGVIIPSAKKSKLATNISNMTPSKSVSAKPILSATNACPEFPNGWAYCHQCNKKRDVTCKCRANISEFLLLIQVHSHYSMHRGRNF